MTVAVLLKKTLAKPCLQTKEGADCGGGTCCFLGKMNWLYDSVEPRVMDEDMLKLAVGEQGPRDEAGQLARQEGLRTLSGNM